MSEIIRRFTPPSSRAPLNIAPYAPTAPSIYSVPPALSSPIATNTPMPSAFSNPPPPPPTSVTFTPPYPSTNMSTAITKGIHDMPAPTSSKAPSFDGEAPDLLDFFEVFDDLAKSCGLNDAEKCKMIVRYVDKTTKLFWVRLKGYQCQDYALFKQSIFHQYPGAEKGVHYTLRDLELVVTAPTNDDITTETELVYYYRQFYPIAEWLVENKKVCEDQRNRYFWQGLPPVLRQRIEIRLEHKKADYSRDEATNIDEVMEAGRFVLSDKAFDAHGDDLISARIKAFLAERSTTTSSSTDKQASTQHSSRVPLALFDSDNEDEEDHDSRRKDTPRDVRTKRVRFDSSLSAHSKSHMDEVEDLSRKMHTLDISDVAYSVLFSRLVLLAPAVAQHWASPSSRQLQGSTHSACCCRLGFDLLPLRRTTPCTGLDVR